MFVLKSEIDPYSILQITHKNGGKTTFLETEVSAMKLLGFNFI